MAERDVQETAQPPRFDTWPREKTVPAYTVYEAQRLEASSVRRGLCKFDGRCSPRRSATPGSGGQPDQALSLKPGPEVSNTGMSIYLPRTLYLPVPKPPAWSQPCLGVDPDHPKEEEEQQDADRPAEAPAYRAVANLPLQKRGSVRHRKAVEPEHRVPYEVSHGCLSSSQQSRAILEGLDPPALRAGKATRVPTAAIAATTTTARKRRLSLWFTAQSVQRVLGHPG